ncbi:MAG: hypothetical protein CL946_02605, partial [Ectothiorhodospiraceae bacterium]|nr:hypothetical protein [Ectothiorhodospiraceae bacterium]
LPIRATVEISMYNSLGERVKKIVSGDFTAGTYSASLDGANLEPGVYFVEMRAVAGPNAASIQRVKTVVTR